MRGCVRSWAGKRRHDKLVEDVEELTPMPSPLFADVGRRGGDYHEVELWHHEDVLAPVSPGKAAFVAANPVDPPRVAVFPIAQRIDHAVGAEARAAGPASALASLARLLAPRFANDLPSVGSPFVQVHL